MSVYKFGDFEVEFDPTDVVFVETYEAAAENYQNKVKAISAEGKASETMKSVCGIFFETFDDIFCAGAHKKMFGKVVSVDLCVKAFKELVDIMNDYSGTLEQLTTIGNNPVTKKQN